MEAPAQLEVGEALRGAGSRRAPKIAAPGWIEWLGPGGIAKVLVLAALVSWMYWDHFKRLYNYWLQPDWSHGFLIPLFALYIVNMKRVPLITGEHRGSWWGAAAMLLAMAGYIGAIYAKIGYPQPLSIILMIAGIVLLMRGWRTLWLTLFPIGILVLAMPPPERMYREITQPLQQGAAAVSTAVLAMFPGAEVERAGVNISYWVEGRGQGSFAVAGACSGMRSLMAFVALGLMMAYFTPRPMWHRLTMAASVVPVALFCNVLRVIATGSFQMYGYGDLASGTPHAVLGMITFAIGFVIYLGILWVLDHLYVDQPEPVEVRRDGAGSQ